MSVETPVREATERGSFRAADEIAWPPAPAYPAQGPGPPARGAEAKRGAIRHAVGVALEPSRLRGAIGQALILECERGTPFLLVPVMIAVGALIYFGLSDEPAWGPILAALGVCAVALVPTTPGRPAYYAMFAILLVAAGMALAKAETWRAGTRVIGSEISTRATGRVVAIDLMDKGRTRLTLDVEATARPTLRYAPARIRVTMRGAAPAGLAAGDRIEAVVRLRPPPGPVRPDSYDFSFQNYFEGIGASGYVLKGPTVLAHSGEGQGWAAAIENVRARVAERIRERIGGAEGEIAAALMVGVRAGIPAPASEALRRTGLYHIISISGLHMALVAGTVIGAVRVLFALFPGFSARRPVRKYGAVAGLTAITAYLVISGGEVAAQRSYLMLAVMLAALLFDRAALSMRNLAISATIVLVVSPHEVAGPSFQMSFAATAALVGAYALWAERRRARAPRPQGVLLPRFAGRALAIVLGVAMTSLVAGLATAAFGAWHFQRVSPLSVAANLAVMPFVSVVVVPAASLAAVLMPLGLDGPCLTVMGWGLSAMLAVAQWFSDRSPLDAVGLVSGWGVALLTIGLTIATVATTRLRWAAVPFFAAGLAVLPLVRPPEVLVAEDGRLVGFKTAAGDLAVNRPQPNAFTADSWTRALQAEAIARPAKAGKTKSDAAARGFICDGNSCRATLASGRTILYTADLSEAGRACAFAAIIVLDDATSTLRCTDPAVAVVTKRNLARFGGAAVFLSDGHAEIVFAAGTAARPWHDHRRFSREARGLPPYRRVTDAAKSQPAPAENAPATAVQGPPG